MIDRDERVLVLVENDAGDVSWLHSQPAVAQETPYRFRTVAELAAPDSCRANRGGDAGSLLLVNHWVDTPPNPRPSIADEVNARPFLDPRLELCQETQEPAPHRRGRRLLPAGRRLRRGRRAQSGWPSTSAVTIGREAGAGWSCSV